jgi:hypothetical protein
MCHFFYYRTVSRSRQRSNWTILRVSPGSRVCSRQENIWRCVDRTDPGSSLPRVPSARDNRRTALAPEPYQCRAADRLVKKQACDYFHQPKHAHDTSWPSLQYTSNRSWLLDLLLVLIHAPGQVTTMEQGTTGHSLLPVPETEQKLQYNFACDLHRFTVQLQHVRSSSFTCLSCLLPYRVLHLLTDSSSHLE